MDRKRKHIQPYRSDLPHVARKLRADATFPERLLWSRLRRKQLGVRFLRQRPIGEYVVDFYCPDAGLVVEVDGQSHDGTGIVDLTRQDALERMGLRVVRLQNNEVLANLDGVVRQIAEWLETTLKA